MRDNTHILEPLKEELWRTLEEGGRMWNPREGVLLHQFGVRCARAAEVHYRHSMHGYDRRSCERDAAVRYPLPPKRVLREEPVPGESWPLYRVRDGILEVSGTDRLCAPQWQDVVVAGHNMSLMRHAVDLSERPYREETQ